MEGNKDPTWQNGVELERENSGYGFAHAEKEKEEGSFKFLNLTDNVNIE